MMGRAKETARRWRMHSRAYIDRQMQEGMIESSREEASGLCEGVEQLYQKV